MVLIIIVLLDINKRDYLINRISQPYCLSLRISLLYKTILNALDIFKVIRAVSSPLASAFLMLCIRYAIRLV